ncbi:MAG TPA: hypothetical protein VG754_08165, partial [Verrucomicrobiae bacterium]|nr:hypothetical protein [Verrucomicrobiae bacterium]
MPLQDLTPQLRTRLNRMERAVGWFIMLATLLLLVGLGYYIYKAAESRGWFKIKAQYFVYTERGDGLAVGGPVNLMGFNVGRILEIKPMPPMWGQIVTNNVYVKFEVLEPNFGYIWTDSSRVSIKSGFLNARQLDISKGLIGYATYISYGFRNDMTVAEAKALPHPEEWRLGQEIRDGTNLVLGAWKPLTNNWNKLSEQLGSNTFCAINPNVTKRYITAVWNDDRRSYELFKGTNIYGLPRYEEPALNDELQSMVLQVKAALPGILDLTNKIDRVLANTSDLTSNLNAIAANARPAVANLNAITERLKDPNGSLGEWVLPTNINQKLDSTLQAAGGTLTNLDTNLMTLNLTLQNLANITSNLNN